jgi:hypothetical protein
MDDALQTELKAAEAEIDVILKKYDLGLQPVTILTAGKVETLVNLVKLEKPTTGASEDKKK